MLIRPVKPKDLNALVTLAGKDKIGLTTLPADKDLIEEKIKASRKAFSVQRDKPEDDHYLFVLEDCSSGKVVGTSGIVAAVGVTEAFYSYKLGTTVHASRELDVYNKVSTLHLSNDYTGCSELCTLFLDDYYRKNNNGKLLSKCRFLFMAEFLNCFAPKVIAELRGYCDDNGRLPFWDGLGRHFFSMEFSRADFLSGSGNKSFIAELMPRHPVYVNLLSKETQAAIGKVHESTGPALNMLEKEGFSFQGYVDIFDAGPTVEAQLKYIRAVRYSRVATVTVKKSKSVGKWHVISNREFKDFRCCLTKFSQTEKEEITIDSILAKQLKVKTGDSVRIVALN
jgi:arginine N-succinyltransferase